MIGTAMEVPFEFKGANPGLFVGIRQDKEYDRPPVCRWAIWYYAAGEMILHASGIEDDKLAALRAAVRRAEALFPEGTR